MEDKNVIIDWLQNPGVTIGLILLGVWLVRNFGMIFISRIIKRSIRNDSNATDLDHQRREDTLIAMVGAVVRVGLYIIAAMIILSELGIDIGPLVAGASVAGLAIGLGAQSLIKDFVAGLFIIMENQFRVGDVVELAGKTGTVQEITIRSTVLRDLSGNEYHIPNGSIDVSTNMTMRYSGINMDISISYDSDADKAEKIINDVGIELGQDESWRDFIDEAPHALGIDNFGTSEVVIKVIGKVKPGKQWQVAREFRKRLKKAFEKSQIEIPYPQLDVHQKKK